MEYLHLKYERLGDPPLVARSAEPVESQTHVIKRACENLIHVPLHALSIAVGRKFVSDRHERNGPRVMDVGVVRHCLVQTRWRYKFDKGSRRLEMNISR
jgi:hypothetical protein